MATKTVTPEALTCAANADHLMREVERLLLSQPEKYDPRKPLAEPLEVIRTVEALLREARKQLIEADMRMGRM